MIALKLLLLWIKYSAFLFSFAFNHEQHCSGHIPVPVFRMITEKIGGLYAVMGGESG